MTGPRWAVTLLALPLLLGGCAAADGATSAAGSTASPAATADGGGPPAAAEMVCGDEIRGEIAQVLSLPTPAPADATWADSVYTCTHQLPMGALVLSVEVSPSTTAAGARFDTRLADTAQSTPAAGLGERAYATPDGTVVVIKDDMTLTVDATGLPAVLGSNGQQRNDLAYEIASVVLGCWTGDE